PGAPQPARPRRAALPQRQRAARDLPRAARTRGPEHRPPGLCRGDDGARRGQAAPRRSHGMTIPATVLVIDDDPASIAAIGQALADLADVIFATSGDEGIERARLESPDLVLLDVLMPGLDGIEVCARLKRDPRTRDIPVVFISAAVDEDQEARGLLAGA